MSDQVQKVTKLFLKSLGLSDYLTREAVKNADYSVETRGYRLYNASDIVQSIEAKLANPKTKDKTRNKLQTVLKTLQGESNVMTVNFLQKLSPEKRVEVLKNQLADLENQEKELTQETNELIQKARIMVSAN